MLHYLLEDVAMFMETCQLCEAIRGNLKECTTLDFRHCIINLEHCVINDLSGNRQSV